MLIFLILEKFKTDNTNTERKTFSGDFQDIPINNLNEIPKKNTYIHLKMNEKKMAASNLDEQTRQELQEAKSRIELLEKKIAVLEGRMPQKYPEVEYLGHKERKRILVSFLE